MLHNKWQLNTLECKSVLDVSKNIHKWEKKWVLILWAHVSMQL